MPESQLDGLRVLVVDDEEVVREVTRALLESLGATAVLCASGEEAVAVFAREHAGIDLALVDLLMPGMDGADCFRALRRIEPGLRAILVSGFARDARAEEALAAGMAGFIQKPCSRETLQGVLARALSPS